MTEREEDSEQLVADAFTREVPEVSAGTVTLRAIAREPGVRTKVAVASADPRIDPVVTCVGADQAHIQAIRRAFPGEQFDILPWAETPERFIRIALAPVSIVSSELDAKT